MNRYNIHLKLTEHCELIGIKKIKLLLDQKKKRLVKMDVRLFLNGTADHLSPQSVVSSS